MPANRIRSRLLSRHYTTIATCSASPLPISSLVRFITTEVSCHTTRFCIRQTRHKIYTSYGRKPKHIGSHWTQPLIQRGTGHIRTMSSDDAYTSFLEQANQDTSGSKASAKSNTATTKAVDTEVPTGLQNVEQYYTSEADEPFEPVSLRWDGTNMPSESTLNTSA